MRGLLPFAAGCGRWRAAIAAALLVGATLAACGPGARPAPEAQVAASRLATEIANYRQSATIDASASASELALFAAAFDRVKASYVRPVDDAELIMAAVDGMREAYPEPDEVGNAMLVEAATQAMLQSLDAYSTYLDRNAFRAIREETQGKFGGLGVEITKRDGELRIVSPIDGTPAARAGLRPDDVITHADGEALEPLSLREAVKRLRGRPGDPVVLDIRRGAEEAFQVTITREVIRIQSVQTSREGDVGYIRVSTFTSETGAMVAEAIVDFFRAEDGGVRAFVLDLRNNPGGLLEQSITVSDIFLGDGLVLFTKGRNGGQEFFARAADLTQGRPLVVLINKGSASAAEIVAGALQDHQRGVLVGERTFGKGSVQTIYPLGGGQGLKLTTAYYFTPNGRTVDGGIDPDVIVADDEETPEDEQLLRAMELAVQLTGGPSVFWSAGVVKQ